MVHQIGLKQAPIYVVNVFETAIEPSPELRFACAAQSLR